LGRWDQADTVIQRLDQLRAQLPVLGVLQLDALHALLRGDTEERLRLTKEMAARDSSPISLMLTGQTANRLLRPRDAIPALERSDSLMLASGEVVQVIALASAYHEADSHDAELRTVLTGRRLFPSAVLLESQLRAYGGLRRSAEAEALADTILRGITDSVGRETRMVVTGALELRAHGDSLAAGRLLGMVRAWYAAHPVKLQRPPRIADEGRVFYLTGQLDSAESRFAVAARDTLNLEAQGYLGLIRARRGDKKGAALIADVLGALPRKWMFGTNTTWSSAIVGALGDKARAVQLLRRSKEHGATMETWHYAPQLDALRGYPPFEELIRPQR
jgi:hypothetical protein